MTAGEVQETGDFTLDGVTFSAAKIQVDFINSTDGDGAMFPTGSVDGELEVAATGTFKATMISTGIPFILPSMPTRSVIPAQRCKSI